MFASTSLTLFTVRCSSSTEEGSEISDFTFVSMGYNRFIGLFISVRVLLYLT